MLTYGTPELPIVFNYHILRHPENTLSSNLLSQYSMYLAYGRVSELRDILRNADEMQTFGTIMTFVNSTLVLRNTPNTPVHFYQINGHPNLLYCPFLGMMLHPRNIFQPRNTVLATYPPGYNATHITGASLFHNFGDMNFYAALVEHMAKYKSRLLRAIHLCDLQNVPSRLSNSTRYILNGWGGNTLWSNTLVEALASFTPRILQWIEECGFGRLDLTARSRNRRIGILFRPNDPNVAQSNE